MYQILLIQIALSNDVRRGCLANITSDFWTDNGEKDLDNNWFGETDKPHVSRVLRQISCHCRSHLQKLF